MSRAVFDDTTVAPEILDRERMLAAMRKLRRQAEEAAERLIALLDEIDGDADLEPYLAGGVLPRLDPGGELEAENEHGGDINDEPHDDSDGIDGTDAEPELGWTHGLNQARPQWRGEPATNGRFAWAVLDGEAGDDNGIGDECGIRFDDGPEPSGFGDVDGMTAELTGEASLGWTTSCSEGRTDILDLGAGGDLEPNGDETDHSFSEDEFHQEQGAERQVRFYSELVELHGMNATRG